MGFFLRHLWLWWLLAAVVAVALTWLVVHVWSARLDRRHCAPHEQELKAAQARIAEQQMEIGVRRAATDPGTLAVLRAAVAQHDGDDGTVATLTARLAELQLALQNPTGS